MSGVRGHRRSQGPWAQVRVYGSRSGVSRDGLCGFCGLKSVIGGKHSMVWISLQVVLETRYFISIGR